MISVCDFDELGGRGGCAEMLVFIVLRAVSNGFYVAPKRLFHCCTCFQLLSRLDNENNDLIIVSNLRIKKQEKKRPADELFGSLLVFTLTHTNTTYENNLRDILL